jgi:hypothetical protein
MRGMLLGMTLVLPAILGAQPRLPHPPITAEVRLDTRISDHSAIEGGGSVILPAGIYTRVAFTAAVGVSDTDSSSVGSARGEVIARFLLDPFRESRYGLSIGGGIGISNSEGLLTPPKPPDGIRSVRWRPYLAVVVDLETKKTAGWTPAVQIGLGGGMRIGLALRSGTDYWR